MYLVVGLLVGVDGWSVGVIRLDDPRLLVAVVVFYGAVVPPVEVGWSIGSVLAEVTAEGFSQNEGEHNHLFGRNGSCQML